MKIITEYPRPVREIENTWIPLADGTRLAARIWLPEDAAVRPVPAILEYIPYRKNDATAARDAIQKPYLAGHGYAALRVDMRGSGESDGILLDEYLPQEQEDALEVLAWIAAQAWCTGAVGMIGISWGGFNSLQVAARRPPELKAIITVCSTDDRYADDVHYMGGCLLANAQMRWASTMFANNARPPDPRFVGERWREMWLERLKGTAPFVEAWLSHQRRDDFWKQGSVCENYADIICPVYAVGGWADAYTNAVPRLLEGLSVPRKGLIGPWAHRYPEQGIPGPAIGFLQESLRWWDHWLKGVDTGIMAEPMLRVWLQESVEPSAFYEQVPGRWVAEPSWPSPHIDNQHYYLGDGVLDVSPSVEKRLAFTGSLAAGLDGGLWCAHGLAAEMPTDQRAEDGRSLTFTSAPAEQRMEILGFPEVTLDLSVDRPQALVAVRLCDVAPSGSSLLVTRGLLNLTHRDSHEQPEPLVPGRRYQVTVRLNAAAHALPVGHRWRVAVSPTYWPWAWPSPEPVTLSLFTGSASRLALPVRAPRPEDASLAPWAAAEGAPALRVEVLRAPERRHSISYDSVLNQYEVSDVSDGGGRRLLDNDLEYDSCASNIYTIVEGEPLSARVRCERTIGIGRAEWQTRVETTSIMTADGDTFYLENTMTAFAGESEVFSGSYRAEVPRDHV